MSDKKYIKGKNGVVRQWFPSANMTSWEYCDKDGNTVEDLIIKESKESSDEPEINSLKEKAKELKIRGWNNAKEDTLKRKIAELEAENGEEEGS